MCIRDRDYTLAGVERFALTCVEAFGGAVAAVKPQSAFFEVFGAAGVALLERVVRELRAAGTAVILDVKRGDIGSTMEAYAHAFLGPHAPAPPDAITVSPYPVSYTHLDVYKRQAQLHRPAGPGHRGVRGDRSGLAEVGGGAGAGIDRRHRAGRIRRGHAGAAEQRGVRCVRRRGGQHLLPQCGQPRAGLRLRCRLDHPGARAGPHRAAARRTGVREADPRCCLLYTSRCV